MCCENSNTPNAPSTLEISIFKFFMDSCVISRSEGRRLAEGLDSYKIINLDFANIEEVGQAFIHEIFVIWQNKNPNIILNVLNANDDVDFMIKRVKNTI